MRWRKVVGFPRYLISDCGKVWDTEKLRFLKGYKMPDGYIINTFPLDIGKRKRKQNHRLVAEAFLPNPLNKREVNHIDGDKSNNNLSNLEWATRSENTIHAWKNGLITKCTGEKSNLNKYPEKMIRAIHSLKESGRSATSVSKDFGCTPQYVGKIWRQERWKHLHV